MNAVHPHLVAQPPSDKPRVLRFDFRQAAESGVLLASLIVATAATGWADTIPLVLPGNSDVDLWGANSLTAASNPGYPGFPGSGIWPGPIQSSNGGDSFLNKVANGSGGGPFPSGSGIYFGGFDTAPNTNGGTLSVVDTTPVSAVKTISLQIQIGQAFGYDLLNNNLAGVTLSYTTAAGTFPLGTQAFSGLLNRFYNGSIPMPTGPGGALQPEDIYVNLWGFQWNLGNITEPILSYEIRFTAVQHASLAQLQLNQTDAAFGSSSVFPQDHVWIAGGVNNNWTTPANWTGGNAPSPGRNAVLNGSAVVLDSNQNVGLLTIKGEDGFVLGSSDGAILEIASGITTSATSEAFHNINAPIHMSAYNLLEVDPDTVLTLSGPISGAGFYKQGGGDLLLTGDNVFDGSNASLASNGLILRGGINRISGINSISGSAQIGFNIRQDTTVVLLGGDDRLDAKFVANLLASSSRLVLGDSHIVSDQTFAGLTGVAGAQIVGGGSHEMTALTVNSTGNHVYAGRIGGTGVNENNLTLIKDSSGTLTLAGRNTHAGGTVINGGVVEVNGDAAFGTGTLVVNGGGIRYGAAFDNLRNFTVGESGGALDTGAFNVNYDGQISGFGRLVKTGGKGTLTLTGVNAAAGGTGVTGGFLSIDADDRLGPVPESPTPSHIVLNGGGLHASGTFSLDAYRGIALGAPSGNGHGWLSVAAGAELSYGGTMANGGTGAGSLYKLGDGTLELGGANSYTGTTDVYHGTLVLDFSAVSNGTAVINPASSLRLYGGEFDVKAEPGQTASQTFSALNITAGHSTIKDSSSATVGVTVGFANVTRSTGATLDFVTTAAGSINPGAVPLTNGILTSAAGPDSVTYATVGNNDWATLSDNQIVAFSGYETSLAPGDWTSMENVALGGNVNGVTTASINTLKLDNGSDVAIDAAQTLTLTSGGLLITGSGPSQISGGTLRGSGGTTKELLVFQNNANEFMLSSVIANDNAPTALVKSGRGTLVLSGANSFTGPVRINEGTLSFQTAGNLGAGSATTAGNLVIDGGTLKYLGGPTSMNRAFTIGYNGAVIDSSGTGTLNLSNTSAISLLGAFPRTLRLGGTNSGDNTLGNLLNDAGAGATSLVKEGEGTWVLTPGASASATNGFTGGVTINGGTLKLGRPGALNRSGVNPVHFGDAAGTKLALNGNHTTIAGLSSENGNPIVENGGTADAILTINNGAHHAFHGTLQDGGGTGALSLIKDGFGSFELSGVNTYTGSTQVLSGELIISGELTSTSEVTIGGNGLLQVDGTIGGAIPITIGDGGTLTGDGIVGAVNLDAGGTLSLESEFGDLQASSLNWDSDGRLRFELGPDPAAFHQLKLTGALTKGTDGSFLFEFVDFGMTAGVAYELVSFESSNFNPADFTYLTESATLAGTFQVDADSVNFVASVPEPGSTILLCSMAGYLGLIYRKRVQFERLVK